MHNHNVSLSKYENINENNLMTTTGGCWKVIGGIALFIAEDAFTHTDQISSGWKKAGKKTFF